MPGLRIVRVGSQNTRTYNSFRTRRAVAPILPGFIGDALPWGKHALVNGPVHAASDDSNKYCATCLQETSSIQGHRLQGVARRKRRVACSYSSYSLTSLQSCRRALIFSALAFSYRAIRRRARYLESQADAVARDRALVPIFDFAQDTLQIVVLQTELGKLSYGASYGIWKRRPSWKSLVGFTARSKRWPSYGSI